MSDNEVNFYGLYIVSMSSELFFLKGCVYK